MAKPSQSIYFHHSKLQSICTNYLATSFIHAFITLILLSSYSTCLSQITHFYTTHSYFFFFFILIIFFLYFRYFHCCKIIFLAILYFHIWLIAGVFGGRGEPLHLFIYLFFLILLCIENKTTIVSPLYELKGI